MLTVRGVLINITWWIIVAFSATLLEATSPVIYFVPKSILYLTLGIAVFAAGCELSSQHGRMGDLELGTQDTRSRVAAPRPKSTFFLTKPLLPSLGSYSLSERLSCEMSCSARTINIIMCRYLLVVPKSILRLILGNRSI